jgi:hypothetical protein
MHIYDYLFAAIVIVTLLLGSTVMVTVLSEPIRTSSEKDLLKMAAEKIMIQLLLDPGYPYNWGTENTAASELSVFGLAKYGLTSRQAYELDPDKVSRINCALEGTQANFINAKDVARLLCLNNSHNSLDYGFTLEFEETLRVNFSSLGDDRYSVSVISQYSLPIIGANVSGTLYFLDGNSISSKIDYNQTSYDGNCTLTYGDAIDSPSKILAVAVDYFGSQTLKFFNVDNSVSTSLFSNYVLAYPSNPLNVASGYGREILLIKNSSGVETRDFQIEYSATPGYLTLYSLPEPSAVGIVAVSLEQQLVYAQRDFSGISYRTLPAVQSAASAYSLERTVLISGTTYLATLYFWRMS